MEVNNNALVQVDDIKDLLNIKTEDQDNLLEDICNWATAVFEDLIHRKIKNLDADGTSVIDIEFHDGGRSTLFLKNYPIIDVVAVYNDVERVFDEDSLLDPEDYIIHSTEGMIELVDGLKFTKGSATVRVDYTSGYAVVPNDIKFCVLEIAALMFKGKDSLGVSAKSNMEGSVTYFTSKLSPFALAVIDANIRRNL